MRRARILGAVPALDALTTSDFATPQLTRDDARAVTPYLDEAPFAKRWNAAVREGPLKLFRSFPGLWWRDLRAVDSARIPGGRTLGFGDAHLENFGYLHFAEGVRFAFNDLDDSGDVEVALDALRYFTSVALAEAGDVTALVERWRDALTAPPSPVLEDPAAPPPPALRLKALKAWKELRRSQPPLERKALDRIGEALAFCDATRGYALSDARRREVEDGGSGGLDRYWALTQDRDGNWDVLELKAMAPPASDEGRTARPIERRLSTMREALWTGHSLTPYHRTDLVVSRHEGSRRFLVRSRGMRASVKVAQPEVQVRAMGAVHGRAKLDVTPDACARWIIDTVPVVADRWRSMHARAEPLPVR